MLRRKKSDKLVKPTSRSSSKMDNKEEDEDRWVFDSLVGFLTGPIWNMPLFDFIESKCCEFETLGEKDEHFAVLHNEYKQLVDMMLNSFMQDMGISAEQFEKACINARSEDHEGLAHIRQTLLQQICAAEDYDVFIHMMVQKNNELQLQTLQYLQNFGKKSSNEPDEKVRSDETDKELQDVLLLSLKEHEELMTQLNKEKEEVESILATTLEEERERLENENRIEMEMLKKAMQLSLDESDNGVEENTEAYRGDSPSPSVTTCSSPLTPDSHVNNGKELKESDAKYKMDLLLPKSEQPTTSKNNSSLPKSQGISDSEIASRREYLRQQRDKIIAMKRNVRKMQMNQLDDNPAILQRPKSAKTAKDVLENNSNTVQLDPEILAARQALARRLKSEVVGQH